MTEQRTDPTANELATAVAGAVLDTPGIARLHPYAVRAARRVLRSAVRRGSASGESADDAPTARDVAAVDVRIDETGPLVIAVRVVATGQPPVIDTVAAVQQRVDAELDNRCGRTAVVDVQVLDVELAADA